MKSIKDKDIILGVTGSIAAYKTPQLVRLLKKDEANVKVVMTKMATLFVTALSLSTVSENPVLQDLQESGVWNNHVKMARSADLLLIAPASANTIAKMANGICDNLLLAAYLSANCPVVIAPAMDTDMWQHPTTRANIEKLKSFGIHIVPVGIGHLASGLTGPGRMAEPEDILTFIQNLPELNPVSKTAAKKWALVTAGPTYEAIDPVRFIGNYSSGKMGTALALSLAHSGYHVHLIKGPGVPDTHHPEIENHSVTSAQEMFEASKKFFPKTEIAILAAAVADYRPAEMVQNKIKKEKQEGPFVLQLVENPDILAYLGAHKKENQTVVGFALETDHEIKNAQSKLARKKADYIVLNSLRDKGAGFGTDTNKVTILSAQGEEKELPLQSKQEIANEIISWILR